ncbi:hypothetical protein [Spectribacter hydrogenoxidans]|uniref:ABC transmembrane type-1 domain-containing protein n=1 Tax=Spectribacter hydrogenoxidans TaxID=3075608 RepID=A0ABU3BWM2_9GAMM|nr:hypothetical protein [Salinisphaera sp. W335]MDT0633679.1 hypothetical protein [Salinisphaera sp. W335]
MPDQSDSKVAAALELPARLVQTGGIVAVLLVAYGDLFHTLLGVIAGLIWIKVTSEELPQELGDLRVKRQLFQAVAEWLGRSDGGEVFDNAYSEHLYMDEGIQAPRYDAVAKAKGIANIWTGLLSLILQCYLVVVIVQVALNYVYG